MDINGSDEKAFRLHRGDGESTLVLMDEIGYLVREYNITQIDLVGMVHLTDLSFRKIFNETK